MILLAPDDRVFTTAGVSYAKGDRIDVADLAARLGVDPDGLAADLLAQGFAEAKPCQDLRGQEGRGQDRRAHRGR